MKQTAVIIVVLIVSSVESFSRPATPPAVLSNAASRSDTLDILEAIQVVSVADPSLAKSLSRLADLQAFRATLEKFKRADPERWNEMLARIQFCREKGYAPPDLDVRVRMVLENGPWTSEWVEPMECNTDTCVTWIYTYAPSPTHSKGLSVICEGDPRGKFPTRINSQDRVVAKLAGPLFPFVIPALLPEWGSDLHQVSVGVTVPADQLTQPTLDGGVLHMRFQVYERVDNGRGPLIAEDEITTNIEPLRAVLARSQESQWRNRGAPGYLGCHLPPGEYILITNVVGAHLNAGNVTIDLTVPQKPLLSDLVLIRDVSGTGLDAGVQRGDDSFYSVSRPEFVPGTEITIRLEFRLPVEFNGRYNVWATLVPIPEIRSENRPTYGSSMNVVYWEDEDGKPKYGSVLPPEVMQPVKRDHGSITLIDQIYRTQNELVELEEKVRLSARPGKYVLAVQIADSGKQEVPLGMKAMVIRILPR